MKRSSYRSLFTFCVVASTLGTLCGCEQAAKQVGARVVEGSSDETIRRMFEAANAACPTRMDTFTTLVEVKMIDERQVEFRYEVSDEGKKIASRMNKKTMKSTAVAQMKGNPMAVAIAERDLSIEHIYADTLGRKILAYTINREVLNEASDVIAEKPSDPVAVTTVGGNKSNAVVEKVEEKPALPQEYKPRKRSKDNPAGMQSNPFFGS